MKVLEIANQDRKREQSKGTHSSMLSLEESLTYSIKINMPVLVRKNSEI